MLDTRCLCNFEQQKKQFNVVHLPLHYHFEEPVYFRWICIISFAACNLIIFEINVQIDSMKAHQTPIVGKFQMDNGIYLFLFLLPGKSRSHGTCWRLWIQRTKGLSRDESVTSVVVRYCACVNVCLLRGCPAILFVDTKNCVPWLISAPHLFSYLLMQYS